MTKEQIQRVIDQLPDEVSLDELMERRLYCNGLNRDALSWFKEPLLAMKKQANS